MALGTSIDRENRDQSASQKSECLTEKNLNETSEITKSSENGCSDEEVPSKCFRADLTQLNVKTSSVVAKNPSMKMSKTDVVRSKLNRNNNVSGKDQQNGEPDVYQNGNGAGNSDESEEETCTEKGELEASGGKAGEKNYDLDVVFVQDVGFTVKIQSPGVETFEIQVSSMELVQEIHQLLMDREDTCHRTCFSLQLDGNTLDNFTELKSIEGLKEGSVIKIVEEPYTMREARIHVRHVRDLLKSLDPADAYNGIDCSSLAFLNAVTQGDVLEKKKSRVETADCAPPDYVMPGNRERPLLPLHPMWKDQKGPQCIKVLTPSGWNPPPGFRKLHGDLMYLYAVTLEDKHYHITACTRGFFVNQSTDEQFDPKAATPNHLCHSLIELLNQISPAFKRNFSALQKKRTQKHPFERVATPYQLYSWVAPHVEHSVDAIRAEDSKLHEILYG